MWNVIRAIFCFALIFGHRQSNFVRGPGLGGAFSTKDVASGTAQAIETEVSLKPHFINFGEVEKGQTVAKRLKLTAIGTTNLRLEQIEVAEHYFVANVIADEENGHRGFKIEVALKVDAPAGPFSETMTLHTNSSRKPRIDVPVYGNVMGRIRVKPDAVPLGVMEKGSHTTNKLEVSSIDRKRFNILEITSKPSFFSVAVTRAKSNSEFEITYKVEDDAPSGKVAGEIKIRTDDSNQPLIEVPLQGLIASAASRNAMKTKRSPSLYDWRAFEHIYITRPPIEEDTYLSAWLIKRFLDPSAEFVFVPIDSLVPDNTGHIFDLPSPYARWTRTNRRCTSEHLLAEVKEQNPATKTMASLVRQLEMGSWLVSPTSDAGRLRSTIAEMTHGTTDPQLRINRVFTYFDDIYAAGGYIP